jgi:hypothetical protein
VLNPLFILVRSYVFRHARPLDCARWRYHFEGGTAEEALCFLKTYQNEDGGFGRALDVDLWGEQSHPAHVFRAIQILREMRYPSEGRPVIDGILGYLEHTPCFDGTSWQNPAMNWNSEPHAAIWNEQNYENVCLTRDASACFAGFILCFADAKSNIYQRAYGIAQKRFSDLQKTGVLYAPFTLHSLCLLFEFCKISGLQEFLIEPNETLLRKRVNEALTIRWTQWTCGASFCPSDFVDAVESIYYTDNRELLLEEYKFILNSLKSWGSWPVSPCRWNYPDEAAISRCWQEAERGIHNMRFLKRFETEFGQASAGSAKILHANIKKK